MIVCQQVTKAFGTSESPTVVLDRVSFTLRENEFLTLIGPSGCGKSTVLKLISGLLPVTSGTVHFRGQPVTKLNKDVGYVTQDNNLLPWLTLRENVELPLVIRGVPASERRRRADEYMEMVGIQEFGNHFPHQLSGGMHKRGAIIRTLIYDPDVILMDEPFGSLDAQTRLLLQQDLLEIWGRRNKTILFITHDLAEAIALSDRVLVMTRRPATVKDEVRIPLPRPRDVINIHHEPGYAALYQRIWEGLKSELSGVRPGAEGGKLDGAAAGGA